jgi:hypothetical protein
VSLGGLVLGGGHLGPYMLTGGLETRQMFYLSIDVAATVSETRLVAIVAEAPTLRATIADVCAAKGCCK